MAVAIAVVVGVAVKVGIGDSVGPEIVKVIEQLFTGATFSALGRLSGTLGATGSCLSSYNLMAVKMAIPARITVVIIIKIVPSLLTGFFIFFD